MGFFIKNRDMKSLWLILSQRRYFSPAWVFASINIMVGTWILYLPYIKEHFILNDAEVGSALFFTACGLLFSIPLVPKINKRFGVGRCTQMGIVLLSLAFNLPLIAPSYYTLCGSLFLVGVFSGFTDISMNAVISIIEKREQQNLMSAAHGFFSLGGFLGAGLGSFLIGRITPPGLHMFLVTTVVLISNLALAHHYTTIIDSTPKVSDTAHSRWKSILPVLGLSMISFIVLFNEGAVEHWSNLFLFEVVELPENQSGFGFVLFSLTMTLGRFLGDGISQKIGAIKTLTYGFITAMGGYGLILTAQVFWSILGFGLLGLGLSVVVPEIVRLAGQNKQLDTSQAISTVSGIGFVGFLIGPVLLGFIANWTALIYSYVFLLFSLGIALGIVQLRLKRRY